MAEFKDGDMVRHLSGRYNHGLGMQVTNVDDDRVKCEWFEGPESIHKVEWFDKKDLVLVSEAESGFTD